MDLEQMLNQILQELRSIKSDIQQLNQNQQLLDQNQKSLDQNQKLLDQNQKQMTPQIDNILQSVIRIEDSQPKDISALLDRIHDNILDKDSEIAALNKRVFRLESDFEKFSRQ
ncbi:hypothetical protein [Paenibacillus medicaginis]|uniref:Uncharacterized protein n=1 Tax=Paenibacillus medicaginis TaxID=1470560 RepID=A0ABV5C8Q6_9BACL